MDKLVDEITEYLQNYPPAFEVFSRLIDIGDIYVMGGILREYRDRGKIKDIRDADFSILIHDFDAWNRLISEIPNKINRFGGYKFLCSGLVVDVWNVKDTWAFKEGLVSVCNDDYFSTLPQSVFLNIDSICYDLKRDIGVIFQEVAVFNELTVLENIDYFCGLYITDKNKRNKCVEDAIELVGLENYKKFYPKQLSGGLLRRLNIVCGIAHKPSIIFLDEPTVAVDPQSRNNILSGIKKLSNDGATIIYTTHYMEEAESICDRIIILDNGKIIASGTTDELKKLSNIEEKITVELNSISNNDIDKLSKFKQIRNISYKDNLLIITYSKGNDNLGKLTSFLKENSISYNKIYSERPRLNDVFLELTGKDLRD